MDEVTQDVTPAEVERGEGERELAEQIVDPASSEGLDLVGPDGVLKGLTKKVLEAGLTEHLGYDKHDPGCRRAGSRPNAIVLPAPTCPAVRSRRACMQVPSP